MSVKRVGILTGGGDVPGLNSIIKSVVYRGWEIGWETIGVRRGWGGGTHLGALGGRGLPHLGPSGEADAELVVALNRDNTRQIDRSGGTILHTSRTNPARMK